MRLEARLMQLEAFTKKENQEPFFFFIEDAARPQDPPYFHACSELPDFKIFSCDGESIEEFQARTKQEYTQAMKASRNKLGRFVVLFGKNPPENLTNNHGIDTIPTPGGTD